MEFELVECNGGQLDNVSNGVALPLLIEDNAVGDDELPRPVLIAAVDVAALYAKQASKLN